MNASMAQLTDHLLSLPIGDRVILAQKLWESLDGPPGVDGSQEDVRALVRQRAADVAEGRVQTVSHEEVMRRAREELQCK